ncbi:MAG: PAS domain S-box protein, partial [Microbacteriaceae bacterium]|nr:PAS domain S-box protein [Microbacteriaceae bacterium]
PERWKEIHRRCLAGEPQRCEEDPFRRQDGSVDWVRWEVRPWHDRDGSIGGIVMLTEVVTERKETQRILREASARYHSLFDQSTLLLREIDVSGVCEFLDELRREGVGDLRAHLEAHAEDIIRCGRRAKILNVNAATLQFYGAASREELIERSNETITLERQARLIDQFVALAEGRTISYFETGVRTLRGEIRYLATHVGVIEEVDGFPAKLMYSSSDITEKRQAEDALRETTSRYRSLFDQSALLLREIDMSGALVFMDELRGMGVADLRAYFTSRPEELLECNTRTRLLSANRATLDFYGARDLDDLVHRAGETITPERQQNVMEQLLALADGRTVPYFETSVRTLRGELRHLATHVGVIEELGGMPVKLMFSSIDISEKRLAEAAIEASRAKYRSLFENSPMMLTEIDLTGILEELDELAASGVTDFDAYFEEHPERIVPVAFRSTVLDANPAALAFYGVGTVPEVAGRRHRTVTDEQRGWIRRQVVAYAAGDIIPDFETTVVRHDGELRQLSVRVAVLERLGGRPWKLLYTTADVTERHRAEAQMRESELRFRELNTSLDHVFWCAVTDPYRVEFVSPSFEHIWGRDCAELYSNPKLWMEVIHPEDREAVRAANHDWLERRSDDFDVEYRIIRPDGTVRWILDKGASVTPENGRYRFTGIARDITERRLAEAERQKFNEQLQQSQKLQAIGTLAAGVAHDFNNLLAAVSGYGELARRSVPDESEAVPALEGIAETVQQATTLTRSLLTFSRNTPASTCLLNLGRLVRTTMKMLRHVLPASIRVSQPESEADDLWVEGDEDRLRQVLLNLVVNARDAMPGGGELAIGVRRLDESHAGQFEGLVTYGHGVVLLEVSDTGAGMSEETRVRAFEPFFTTKPREQGTGLGLSVVHGILADHGGRITIESATARGTRVTVAFPGRAAPEPRAGDLAPSTVPRVLQSASVLLAEDNQQVRGILASALGAYGYEVLQARNGSEALELLRAGAPRMAILDVDMPRTGGTACLAEIRRELPALPVILITGTADFLLPP